MHIPDGYLSPATCAVGFVVAVPMAAVACRKIGRTVKSRQVPTLAMLSAVCFLIMMFNVPIPDGTTAHAVGGALVAVLLGPWAALVAVAVALAFQALLFGDGGVLAYGVNVVNMAIVLPFVAIGIYRLISRRSALTSTRRVVAAAVGGYVGLNAAALCCGIELGIQPELFHTADGAPLYSPYHLAQSVPAMLLAHLSVAGVVEAIITAGVVAYLQRANLPLLRVNNPGAPDTDAPQAQPRRIRPVVWGVGAMLLMVALTPLGLLAPGGAFGEDSPGDLNLKELGLTAVPTGLAKYTGFWKHTLLGDYGFSSGDHPVVGYLLSAVVGIVVIGLLVFLVALVVRTVRGRRPEARQSTTSGPSPAGSGDRAAASVGSARLSTADVSSGVESPSVAGSSPVDPSR